MSINIDLLKYVNLPLTSKKRSKEQKNVSLINVLCTIKFHRKITETMI